MTEPTALEIEVAPVADLVLHPDNPRQGDVGAIAESLKAHGQYKPIIVQASTGFVIAGNHTLMAAKALGWESLNAVKLDVTDDEARRIMLVDNRSSDLATYDDQALADVLQSLAQSGGLEGTGFDGDDLDDLLRLLAGPTTPPPLEGDEATKYLDTVRIVLDLPTALAERFRDCPGENDLERLKGLLGVV